MRLTRLEAYTFPVPFKRVVRHSSATRSVAENFIVMASGDGGKSGYGEGCPRVYVTGEDIESCRKFLVRHNSSLLEEVCSVETLKNWVETHRSEIDQSPSAFCAIEVAILDVIGREENCPIEVLLGIPSTRNTLRYTAVVGDSSHFVFWLLSQRYKQNKFRDVKLKLSGYHARDRRKLNTWKSTQDRPYRIRLDANNHWSSADECTSYLKRMPPFFWAVEEPIQVRDFEGMNKVASRLGTTIILDESLIGRSDLHRIEGNSWICNLRISKLGGILRTMELATEAERRNISVILGCHVGETSLLTRASLVISQFLDGAQVANEGAFGKYLLSEDLTETTIEFDHNATLQLGCLDLLDDPGLGLNVNSKKLFSLNQRHRGVKRGYSL